MKVLILHGYSADNIGDGMLVTEAIELINATFPAEPIDLTLCASDPDSFDLPGVSLRRSKPSLRGYDRDYLATLASLGSFDLIVGVGGGYLRGGNCIELAKALLVHGVQLRAASRHGAKVVYLPQSIGPLRLASAPWFRRHLGRLSRVWARDDRTVQELGLPTVVGRVPDMAVLRVPARTTHSVEPTPVYSVRNLRGGLPAPIIELAGLLGSFDGYVQSQTGGNQDLSPMQSLKPRRILSRGDLLEGTSAKRVVVAVRLHAALMALQAGHYVVHLSYERKGFAAFEDLGLKDFVHNAFAFDPETVHTQVERLLTDEAARTEYDAAVNRAAANTGEAYTALGESLHNAVQGIKA
ncbi:polysaccharide pyruvyl transferase WcaK-like protein [Paenarthrobacter nicotinovorans]|uniref:polysaccharide pyruvyl transferase family protein n=1 Tax=Micrococcaceae TaxID=1268 RepID=UPI000876B668|nr:MULTISPECIES: polysaccharide pyruvyl transferase family protein [Micrococcaceae]MDR6435314.1 polysaccharide pyruvyl transferase WcaK-like protein [Paenarthrobacter nicotinovorans]SCZ49440.1 Polysaccharide pyruvyl transferase family protein WcaK [Arthrobacter sp. UNCCL28]